MVIGVIKTTPLPNEENIPVNVTDANGNPLKVGTISKTDQSYSEWTDSADRRTFTVTCTVKNGNDVISSFTQPSKEIYDEATEELCFMSISGQSGAFNCVENSADNLQTVRGAATSASLSAKMGVKVRYDMSPLEGQEYTVQYAPNSGYVSEDKYALENPAGDGDGRADIISTYYSGISSFINRGEPYIQADDGLFSRTVKLSGTSEANKAPMYSADDGNHYRMIDAWQLTDNDSDIFWPIGNHATVNVTVEDLFKSLSGTAGYDDANAYDNARDKFKFDPTTGLFLYTFTVKPVVGNIVSYVAEYSDGTRTLNFPLTSKYLPSIAAVDESVTVKDQLKIDGWTFSGWKIDETSLSNGVTLANISNVVKDGDGNVTSFNMPDCNVVLKGVLTPPDNVFTLTYNKNDNNLSSTASVPKDSNGDDAPTQTFTVMDCTPIYNWTDEDEGIDYYSYRYTFPERTTSANGYDFGGWSLYSFSDSSVSEINVTLDQDSYEVYAIWENTLTYKPNYEGATQSDVAETYPVGYYVNVKASDTFTPPERAEFKCWNTEADGTGTAYDPSWSLADGSLEINGHMTLYAQWEEDTFRLAYNKNTEADVTNMPDDEEEVKYSELNAAGGYALSTQVPTRTDGVSFLGWYLDSACTGSPVTAVTYEQAVAQKGSELAKGDTIYVYAKWGTPSVSLQYEANTTETVDNMPEQNPVTDLSPDDFKAASGYTLSTEIPTRTGYRFGGWYLDPACTGSPVTAVTYEQASEQKGSDIINGDTVHVYAKWNSWTYRVEYRPGTGHEGASNMPVGRNTDGTEDTSSHVQCFLYGDVHPTSQVTVSTVQPTDEGYTFTGWNVEKAGNISKIYTVAELNDSSVSKVLKEEDFPDDDERTIVATAQWEKSTYTVTYHPNGGTGNECSESVEHGASHTVLANTDTNLGYTRDGYEFSGWNTAADGSGTSYAAGSTISGITANVDLYAQWDKLYTLKFHLNGGTSSTIPASKDFGADDSSISEGSYNFASLVATDPTKTGYTFKGWKNGGDDDPNGGTGTTPTDSNKYKGGETVTVKDKGNLVRTNGTFKEWNTKKDGSGTGYKGDGTDTFIMPASDVTLYAIWTDSSGKIMPSPGTGESDLPLQIAFNMAILALLAVGFVVIRNRKSDAYAG